MAEDHRRISELATLYPFTAGEVVPGDLRTIVDVSDPTRAATGTNKTIPIGGIDPVSEIAVTGAATATLGRWHVCSGTTADYTFLLPTAVGNAGKRIGVRMAPGLTRLVTLDGNGSETIDGALTRVMWAGESAVLISDGAGWSKIGGRSKPMICRMQLNVAQPIATGTVMKILLNNTALDNTGLMADLTNRQITVRRGGIYDVIALAYYNDIYPVSRVGVYAYKNGAVLFQAFHSAYNGSVFTTPWLLRAETLAAGDILTLYTSQNSGGDMTAYGGNVGQEPYLAVVEKPQW